ncbi:MULTISPECIES: serine hydrolase domain-containing protein [Streptomyces]|uniref:serine hydrolase domain-containing protein n=1 Tax=Streptomyces TaxID=1883 RepID=UPI0006FB1C2C|nr:MULTISPECIES: serine hydrolase domain-containing protein [Streptomyces]KQX80445.1 serine hydrolase [Streptomyces sp. Root1319]KQZ19563.1 serine hydrolase [Streptomyces sp. Root55]WRY84731.1 beta-lactamase family protein [Streptomyces clavifer]WUC30443.1 beta-lactamase family protein [Streptomyces clavifer]
MRVPVSRRAVLTVGMASALVGFTGGPTAASAPASRGPAAPPAAAATNGDLRRQVNAILATGVAGVGAEVVSPYGRRHAFAGTPREGRFRMGSLTKTFTAVVALQLADLKLDTPVRYWLPEVARDITVRDLLRHTSRLLDPEIPALTSAEGYRAERLRSYTPEELAGAALRLGRAPEKWSYANTNYLLTAMIIERITGRSWAVEITDRIIRPLGLEATSAPDESPFVPGPHARGWASFGTETPLDVTLLNPSMAVGSGALISSVRDLSVFYAALLGGELLPPPRLAEMTATVPASGIGIEGARYGLGLAELPLPGGGSFFSHFGELLGYHAWAGVTADGSRTAVVYVTGDVTGATMGAMSALIEGGVGGTR